MPSPARGSPSTARFITSAGCGPNSKRSGATFTTSGDSEVLLQALVQWGDAGAALDKLDGMFAFAFWNGRARTLLLARDRMGIKPLYYYSGPRGVAFASEVKVLERGRLVRSRSIAMQWTPSWLTAR